MKKTILLFAAFTRLNAISEKFDPEKFIKQMVEEEQKTTEEIKQRRKYWKRYSKPAETKKYTANAITKIEAEKYLQNLIEMLESQTTNPSIKSFLKKLSTELYYQIIEQENGAFWAPEGKCFDKDLINLNFIDCAQKFIDELVYQYALEKGMDKVQATRTCERARASLCAYQAHDPKILINKIIEICQNDL